MRSRFFAVVMSAVSAAAIAAAPGTGSAATPSSCPLPRFGPGRDYHPRIEPSRFGPHIDNPWFPLRPGTTFVYGGSEDGNVLVDVVTASHRTKVIDGVRTRVVNDRLLTNGVLSERTTDYYAQDGCGNVWYFGEDTAELDEHGRVTSTDGTWHAGIHGAQPGVFMQRHPKLGRAFRQEWSAGVAEDQFRVAAKHVTVRVPYGAYHDALRTYETTAPRAGCARHQDLRARRRRGRRAHGQGWVGGPCPGRRAALTERPRYLAQAVMTVRLLVVEDDAKLRDLLRRGLEEEGFAVDVTGSGEEAVWHASELPCDAVILDIGLPDLDGVTVCQRLRAGGCWAPIIMLTALDGVEHRVRGLDVGADDYLVKPFAFAELVARLRALLRREATPRPTTLTVGDLRLRPGDPRGAAHWPAHRADHQGVRAPGIPDATPRRGALAHETRRARVGQRLRR